MKGKDIITNNYDPSCISEHFTQFIEFGDFSKLKLSFMQVIWYACIWTIWKEKNDIIFNNNKLNFIDYSTKLSFFFFFLVKTNCAIFAFDYHTTLGGSTLCSVWLHPLLCRFLALQFYFRHFFFSFGCLCYFVKLLLTFSDTPCVGRMQWSYYYI